MPRNKPSTDGTGDATPVDVDEMIGVDPIDVSAAHWEGRGLNQTETMVAVTSVLRAQQVLIARITDILRPLGLTFPRYEALVLLEFSPDGTLPLARTSERLMLHPSSVTSTIDWLENRGLVRRTPHRTDRRVTLAQITKKGSKLAVQAMKLLDSSRYGLPAEIDDTELKVITEALRGLRRLAVDYQSSHGRTIA